MLTGCRFGNNAHISTMVDDRYSRNIKDDMKKAMDLLFIFKEEMEKLHPECSNWIETLLQNPNRQNRF